MATMYRNSVEIRTGGIEELAEVFAALETDPGPFNMAVWEITTNGMFEWVEDNIVYLIKKD